MTISGLLSYHLGHPQPKSSHIPQSSQPLHNHYREDTSLAKGTLPNLLVGDERLLSRRPPLYPWIVPREESQLTSRSFVPGVWSMTALRRGISTCTIQHRAFADKVVLHEQATSCYNRTLHSHLCSWQCNSPPRLCIIALARGVNHKRQPLHGCQCDWVVSYVSADSKAWQSSPI